MGNSMVTNNLSGIEAERLHTALSEYNILRSEYSAMITRQFSVISLTITALSVLFGFVVTTFSHENRSPALLPCIFCVLIPSVAMFTGAIWLDTVYRQKKLTGYLCLAEIRINRILRCPVGSSEASAITWECYEADDQGKGLLGKPNRWYYYYCLAFYIVFPWVSALFDIFVMGDPIYIWCIISLAIYLGYISFVIAYCKKILRIEAARKNRFKIEKVEKNKKGR